MSETKQINYTGNILIALASGLNFGFWQESVHAGVFMFLVVYIAYDISRASRDE